jgi:N-acetylglutamate synthase and related acetyltransferases
MTTSLRILSLSSHDIQQRLSELSDILVDCVNGGASVSFMLPFHPDKAIAFWQNVGRSVSAGERILLAAQDNEGRVIGTVQLITDLPENQPHRAEVAKLLVHSCGRRKGVARALMDALERQAAASGKTVLVLDTSTGSGAETFYQQCGWTKVGEIPRFALMPDGGVTATSIYYKFL